ncbi:unnamed protein product [Adineta ricciae]|uniref:Methyltransferase FkbM domain-containing protein n=1 Tax=Adineta ricciae TaxID=249248 RepID=A0A814TSK7_ADIRI|nr:unnamed protein product [Adineta ricciae]CAF1164833.1 unnamed protein product [Adineta ricciae]
MKQITLSSHVNLVNLNIPIAENFTCVKTNQLFNGLRTTVCVHNSTDFLSSLFLNNQIYESNHLNILFRIMWRYPGIALIDVGANFGVYTMFAAAMNRSVIAIECFSPNYNRIVRASQLENVQDKIILIGNAIYSTSGESLQLSRSPENIGSQSIQGKAKTNQSAINSYIVKTIRFDDILPVIKQTSHRMFLLKVDIEGYEYYLFESGRQVFDFIDIPVIHIEWYQLAHKREFETYVVEFLTQRGYIPTEDTCKVLNTTNILKGWPIDVFWIKVNRLTLCS